MAGNDTRVANGQGNYQSGVFVDPQNPDVVYVTSIALMRSTDGGATFESFKGAPGGEDYHMFARNSDLSRDATLACSLASASC